MHVMKKKHPLAETGENFTHTLPIELRTGCRTFEPRHHALFVVLGLQPPDKPGAGVGKALVVKINRVLGGQHHPETEGPGLFQKGQQRQLGRRIFHRRKETVYLVHVKNRPETGGTRLGTHPTQDFIEKQRGKEHALGIRQVADGKD